MKILQSSKNSGIFPRCYLHPCPHAGFVPLWADEANPKYWQLPCSARQASNKSWKTLCPASYQNQG